MTSSGAQLADFDNPKEEGQPGPEGAVAFRSLDELNGQLSAHFATLRTSRAGSPVYGLEHGLAPAELAALFEIVGAHVRRYGISADWRRRPFPLIVASSEIGYEYRGTGTDFWPRFEAAIGASLGHADREQHTRVFEFAHAAFAIRKPPASAWSKAFRHIAWPIANAVAPKEIHRPLARALREVFRTAASSEIDEDLVAELRFAARVSQSSRFSEWLADDALVAAVVLHLLDLPDTQNRLFPGTASRILRDVEADPAARRAVRSAVRFHRERPAGRQRRQSLPGTTSFLIRDVEGGIPELLVRLPALPTALRHELNVALAQHRAGLRPWGVGSPLDVGALIAGLPVPLRDLNVAEAFVDHRPFFGEGTGAGSDEAAGTLLGELAPRQRDPLIFRPRPFSSDFEQVLSDNPYLTGEMRVLTARSAAGAEAVDELPSVAGFRCFQVDVSVAAGREWLRRLGATVGDGPGIEIAGGIRLSDGLRGPVFAEGMPLFLRPTHADGEGEISFRVGGGPAVRAPEGSYAVVQAPAGEHVVDVQSRGFQGQARFTVVRADSDLEPLSIVLEPTAPALDDLLRQQVVFRIAAPVSSNDVPYRLSLAAAGGTFAVATGILEKLPVTLTKSDPVVATLTEQLRASPPPRDSSVELIFELGSHWVQRWSLGWEPTVIDWEDAEGVWRAFADEECLPVLVAAATAPFGEAELLQDVEEGDHFSLLVPVLEGRPQLLDALCIGPRAAKLGGAVEVPARVLRHRRSRGPAIGIEAALDAYLGWRLATSSHLLASLTSQGVANELERVLVRQLCGERWSATEQRTPLLGGGAWSALARVAMEAGLASGGCLPEVRATDKARLTTLLSHHLKEAWPSLWQANDAPEAEPFAEAMDLAVIDAYEELGGTLEREGKPGFEDVDTVGDPAAWLRAVRQTEGRQRGLPLAQLVLPDARAEGLLVADYSQLMPEEVVGLLQELHLDLNSRGSPRWITPDDLRSGFLLWVNPTQFLRSGDWLESIVRFLDDRQTSRAVRYAALRFQASRNLLEGP